MRYVCHRRARFEGISGRVNIPYGAALERRGDFLYYQGRQLCAVGSQRAHEQLCGKDRHPDHEDHFRWGNAFFEAPIADLNYIAALVGAGKER